MKTVTKQEAVRGFEVIASLAHAGETVMVTHGGKPWIKLVPAIKTKPGSLPLLLKPGSTASRQADSRSVPSAPAVAAVKTYFDISGSVAHRAL